MSPKQHIAYRQSRSRLTSRRPHEALRHPKALSDLVMAPPKCTPAPTHGAPTALFVPTVTLPCTMSGSTRALYLASLAVLARVSLALSGVLDRLLWRPEVTTPANSLLQIREGYYLLQQGVSPYTGTSCHVPPLVLALLGPLSQCKLLYVVPNILADVLAAAALRSTAAALRQRHGPTGPDPNALALLYLWHPAALLSCVAGTTTAWENAAVLGAVAGAAWRNVPAMTACLAAAQYLGGLSALVLTLPLVLLCHQGPEDSCAPLPPGSSTNTTAAHQGGGSSSSSSSSRDAVAGPRSAQAADAAHVSSANGQCPSPGVGIRATQLKRRQQQQDQPQEQEKSTVTPVGQVLAGAQTSMGQPQPWPTWGLVRRCCLLLVVWGGALVLLSDLHLRGHPQHQCWACVKAVQQRGAVSIHSSSSRGSEEAPADSPGRLCAAGCWMGAVYGYLLTLVDYTPTLGLYWYFFTEMFEAFRPFFRFVFHSHAVIFMVPLALRFSRRPLLVTVAQLLVASMFKAYPSIADYVPWMCLVPLLGQQLQLLDLGLFLSTSLLLLVVLTPAMWHQWINLDAANANFFYSATLLLGVWQLVVLVIMLSLTAAADRALKQQHKQERGAATPTTS